MQAPQSDQPRGKPAQRDSSSHALFEDSDWSQDAEPPVRPLTREGAQAILVRNPSLSVWQVLAAQAVTGVLVALAWGVLSQSLSAATSSLYGALTVVVPSALMARGVFRRGAGRGVGGLLVWEVAKLGLTCALLVLAPRLVHPLNWVAMLVTMVLCLKVIGVALLVWQRREKKIV